MTEIIRAISRESASTTRLNMKARRTRSKGGSFVSAAKGISHPLKPGMEKAPRDGPTAGPAPRRPFEQSDGDAP